MVKNVHSKTGFSTALVALGSFSFVAGVLCEHPLLSVFLLAVARVLP